MPNPRHVKLARNKKVLSKATLGVFSFQKQAEARAKDSLRKVRIQYPLRKTPQSAAVTQFVREQLPAVKFYNPRLSVEIRTVDDAEECSVTGYGDSDAEVFSLAGSDLSSSSVVSAAILEEGRASADAGR